MNNLLKKNVNLNQLKGIAKKLSNFTTLNTVILLKGELGVGKTTFARFFINSIFEKFSLSKPKIIKSPSFPIMINYTIDKFELFHFDMYRINNKRELPELNINENIRNNITIIEWPEILLKENYLDFYFLINFSFINSKIRKVEIMHTNLKEFNNVE